MHGSRRKQGSKVRAKSEGPVTSLDFFGINAMGPKKRGFVLLSNWQLVWNVGSHSGGSFTVYRCQQHTNLWAKFPAVDFVANRRVKSYPQTFGRLFECRSTLCAAPLSR